MSGMRHVHIRCWLAAAAFPLVAALVIGCASAARAPGKIGVTYTCCAADVSTTTWHPGQQLRIAWTALGRPARGAAATTLTVTLIGPYSTVAALKSANDARIDRSREVATAAAIRAPGTAVTSPVSVVIIPADAAPGYYDLRFQAAAGDVASYGATVISVG
jgi:hypothetical protein